VPELRESRYGTGLSNAAEDEDRRLSAAEMLFDPGTFRHLETVGISAGMSCLEIGGGSGSVARWMADRVGDTGSVVVTDIDTTLLVGCDRPNIEIRQHDIAADSLNERAFNLIHARLVLEHVPGRLAVLEKLVAALRPGGWIVIEDLDFSASVYLPPERLLSNPPEVGAKFQRVRIALISMAPSWDAEFGRALPLHLANTGVHRVYEEAWSPLITGGSPQSEFNTLALRQAGPAAVSAGLISQSDVNDLIHAFEQPGTVLQGPAMVSAWGQARPQGAG
jgi:SAM-dependent methyltransferase